MEKKRDGKERHAAAGKEGDAAKGGERKSSTGSDESGSEIEKGYSRYELIRHIWNDLGLTPGETVYGTGTFSSSDRDTLISSDIMLEGIDFNLVYFPLKHLGYKAVVRSIAGIIASGGSAGALSVKAAVSSKLNVEQIRELFAGVSAAAERYSLTVVGIDIKPSVTGVTISTTSWGSAGSARAATGNEERGADDIRPNDLICITGDLGAAYAGLQILERESRIFSEGALPQPDLSDYRYIIGRQLKPDLRLKLLNEIRDKGIEIGAMTIIRDSLASTLTGLCIDKGLGCRLYYEKIPVDSETGSVAGEINTDPVVAALNGGEDYEFLLFAPVSYGEELLSIPDISVAGYLTDASEGLYLVSPDNTLMELKAQGV